MICTRCELWEVTRQDNFCSWCGALWVAAEAALEPPELRAQDYPPPVRLIVHNASPARAIAIAAILPNASWVSLLPGVPGLPCTVEPGQRETFLLDIDTFAAAAGSDLTARITVRLAFAGEAVADLRLRPGGEPPSATAGVALPGARWQLIPGDPVIETANSTSYAAVDHSSGTRHRVRVYHAGPEPSPALLARFIAAAKSMRKFPHSPDWVWFPYTVGPRCYTVGRELPGRRLDMVAVPGKLSRTELRRWLRALLIALRDLHAEAGVRGQMYHGNLELEHIHVVEADSEQTSAPGAQDAAPAPGGPLLLTSGMYLEHIITESPYSPEYFIESDLRHAGLALLSLASGADSTKAPPAERTAMLAAIDDLPVGATLDFLVAPPAQKPDSAAQVLALFDAMVRAETQNHRAEFQKAYALSGSARLPPAIAALERVEALAGQGHRQAADRAAQQHLIQQQQAARRTAETQAARPALDPPFTPVPQPQPPPPPPAAYAVWGRRARLARNFVVRSVKILTATTLLLLAIGVFALIYLLGSWLRESKPATPKTVPSLSFTANPNPVRRGQRSTLNWTSQGYTHVLLDGTPVGTTGFRLIYPGATVTYRLQATTANGSRKSEEVRVVVVGVRPKPKAGAEAVSPPSAQLP